METQKALSLCAGLFSVVAYLPYWYSMFCIDPPVRPHRAAWFIWIFADLMVLTSSVAVGSTENIWVLKAYIVGTIITFILSLKWGRGGTDWFDFVCLGITAVSGILWLVTGSAFLALLINIGVVAIGVILTLLKILDDPYSENLLGYVFWSIGSALSLCAVLLINELRFELWIQPASFLFFQVISILFIIRMRLIKSEY